MLTKTRWMAAAAMVLFALPQAAQAMTFDCDVPADRTSSVQLNFTAAPLIQGIITAHEFRRAQFNPVAGIRVQSPDDSASALLQLAELPEDPGKLTLLVTISSGVEMSRRKVALVEINGQIPFSLRITPEGAVLGEVAGQTFNANVGALNNGLINMFCSSGQFKFSNVTISAN